MDVKNCINFFIVKPFIEWSGHSDMRKIDPVFGGCNVSNDNCSSKYSWADIAHCLDKVLPTDIYLEYF